MRLILAKKKTKRFKPKKVNMEDVYRLINRVQIDKKEVVFSMSNEEACTGLNTIKDAGLDYKMKELKTKVVFTIYPNLDEPKEEEIGFELEFLKDEILEDGQLF